MAPDAPEHAHWRGLQVRRDRDLERDLDAQAPTRVQAVRAWSRRGAPTTGSRPWGSRRPATPATMDVP